MHTVSYEFLMKPEESAGCHQTLSSRVGSGHETRPAFSQGNMAHLHVNRGLVLTKLMTDNITNCCVDTCHVLLSSCHKLQVY